VRAEDAVAEQGDVGVCIANVDTEQVAVALGGGMTKVE
jgi:hypothetical protein